MFYLWVRGGGGEEEGEWRGDREEGWRRGRRGRSGVVVAVTAFSVFNYQ